MVKKILYTTGMLLAGYLILGNLAHYLIFPEELPDIRTYFKPGDRYISDWEGFEQTVIRQEGDRLYADLVIRPHAAGPPEHIHTGFEEVFEVKSGTLAVLVNGEKHILTAGDSLRIPAGTPHKPFNETDSSVVISGQRFSLPLEFAVYLSQVYGYFDSSPDSQQMPGVLLQMAMFNQYFDSWLAEGPPVAVQKAAYFMIRPAARLLGYKSYYAGYARHR